MAAAEELVDKIFSWVKLQNESADKLDLLATELEESKKNINVSKVVGSALEVGGAAAVTTAGIATVLTGGLALPFIATAGAVAAGTGLATCVGSEVVNAVISKSAIDQAKKTSENLENLTKEIKEDMEQLSAERQLKRRQDKDVSAEDYAMEQILRVIAKRNGLILKDKDSMLKLLSELPLDKIFRKNSDSNREYSGLKVELLSDFLTEVTVAELAKVGMKKTQAKMLRTGAGKAAAALGAKASSRVIKKVGGGAIGLLFAVPELINNCNNLNDCETETSKHLREKAKDIRKAATSMQSELDEIKDLCQKLAGTNWKRYRKRSCVLQ